MVDFNDTSTDFLITLLTITFHGGGQIQSRSSFLEKTREVLNARKEPVNELLRDLD